MSRIFLWGGIVCLFALPKFGLLGQTVEIVGAIALIVGWILLVVGR